ncbi:unnamed protein product [Brassica oleracea var. botrytis]|uniref:Uncharacterized protein n=1 Tax=Brassica oleracea TaxID=3712 RepID=A0A3P6ESM0_BRAOL|nr:unnamed protein product [Brassica oleracea]
MQSPRRCDFREHSRKKISPVDHSGYLIFFLLHNYFIKILLKKKYCMPYRVFDALVAHFMRFVDEIRVKFTKNISKLFSRGKNTILRTISLALKNLSLSLYYIVTPEIPRELQGSKNRGEKDDSISPPQQPNQRREV